MTLVDLLPVLQLAIGPVIVVSGVGLVLLSMTNRYARVIDRARQLAEAIRRGSGGDTARLREQLAVVERRGRLLRAAIALTTLSLLLVALLIAALFALGLLAAEGALLVVVLFGGAMLALVAALVLFIRDVNLSLAALRLDLASLPKED